MTRYIYLFYFIFTPISITLAVWKKQLMQFVNEKKKWHKYIWEKFNKKEKTENIRTAWK